MNVLVVAPHPDDEVLGVGGTMARHAADGDNVDVLIITKGDSRYDGAWIAKCRAEAVQSHRLLGVQRTRFLEHPSPTLDGMPFADVVDSIGSFFVGGYNTVYIPHRGDLHQEHRIVHDACLVAFRPPGPDLYAYEVLSSTECGTGFWPNHFVDIGDYLNRKVQAMECYRTQMQDVPGPRSSVGIRRLAGVRGQTIHRDAAEAFETVRTVR